ncbi:hypothetical protein DFH06DRAFT_1443350 [Mycena polygramma]|nr:hypothetical protein DFH06DRAFT_1443350 [Mycena polygramma]
MPISALLVKNGVFPMTPTQPKTAVSIDLLDIYCALFERSCDAITALAAALRTIYDRRGFHVLSQKVPCQPLLADTNKTWQNAGQLAKDPFRIGLQNAVQWYSNLRSRIQKKLDQTLAEVSLSLFPPAPALSDESALPDADASATSAASELPDATATSGGHPPIPSDSGSSEPVPPLLRPGKADRILRERCPACFGLEEWGRPLKDGGDVQLGADGCFSYRHSRKAGDGPISYDPSYFVPKEKVDRVKERIAAARKKAPIPCNPGIPVEVIEACEASWDAANEKKKKADPKCHDSSGVFVMTCRHSQVLFLCDIDTPGEQQAYIAALMEEVNSHLPPTATIVQAYDVGCVTDYSFNLYPILTEDLRPRVCFVINAMHSYGHQWVCQLVYNPHFRRGMCLTDSEGVERFWSRIRKLIPITRHQWNSRRIWTIDQYAMFVNQDGRESLGDWIGRQRGTNLPRKFNAAIKVLRQCHVSETELRRQWDLQKAAQTSIRAHAPVRLRRELDKVLALQTQIEAVEQSIHDTKKSITTAEASPDSLTLLRQLELTRETLSTQADQLYASLNIHESFPELRNLPLEFVRTLLIMQDLKINIRKRAVGTFNEWENLDRAVAGRREALGTKMYQATRKTIKKRQPALLRSINKFNGYCAELEELRPQGCNIPIPSALSTQLNGLRNDPSLHEDVWVTPSAGQVPRWLEDQDVRDGVRSLHIYDRCREEEARLKLECKNMSNWVMEELAIVSKAIECSTGALFYFVVLLANPSKDSILALGLQQRQQELLHLQAAWTPVICRTPSGSRGLDTLRPVVRSAASAISATPQSQFAPSQIHIPRSMSLAADSGSNLMEEPESAEEEQILFVEELNPGTISDIEEVLQMQEMLTADDDEDSSILEADSMEPEINWQFPENLCMDNSLLHDLQARNESLHINNDRLPRTIASVQGRPKLRMEPEDICRISSPTGRLNNFGLNGLAASFLNVFGHPHAPTAATADRCALFNTFDLNRVRYKASDDELWKNVHHTAFWNKQIWLVPIHRRAEEHWVLVAVAVHAQKLFFFDSFSQKSGWRRDLRDIMVLITRLTVLANRHNYPLHITTEEEAWVAQPLFHLGHPRQSNGHDCGIWVLCMIAAILRGSHVAALEERDMVTARQVFYLHALSLPFT